MSGIRSLSTVNECRRRVVVTGIGIICPLGVGCSNSWQALVNSKSGIKKLPDQQYEKLPCRVAGPIPETDLNNYFTKSELRTMCPATAYALIASDEALEDAKWKPTNEIDKRDTGVAVGIGMIDLVDVCTTYEALKKGYNKVSPYFIPRILPNMAAGQISMKYGFRGPNHAVSTACATGAHSIGDGFRFIRNGETSVMVCGGAEACINPLAIAAFCRLRALSTSRNDTPEEASRPFDKNRDGFVMGEGAAIIVLEELKHALDRKSKIYAEVLGYGLSGDAAHLTAPSEDGTGAILAMDRAVKDAGVKITDITYINAHATSTPLGDAIELKAIESLMGDYSENVFVSSTKGAHGHLLGSAGNLEAAFTILSINRGIIPPILNYNRSEITTKLKLSSRKEIWNSEKRRTALKNAFGFGGTNASLCLGEYI